MLPSRVGVGGKMSATASGEDEGRKSRLVAKSERQAGNQDGSATGGEHDERVAEVAGRFASSTRWSGS